MFDLTQYLDHKSDLVNQTLQAVLPESGPSRRVLEAMRYSLMAGGKRLRPVLCLAAAEAVGSSGREAISTACAIEMIHTYSLIHDDLPAMDDDRLRRGRPTCHVAFDEATAILAGDALLTLSFELLAETAERSRHPGISIANLKEIAQAAGCTGMIAGQMQDMGAEGRTLPVEHLEALHRLKTGAMIRVSVRCGARIGNADAAQLQALSDYAEHFGLAFQVTDDILNVEGDPAEMGKAAGTDSARDKNTYPALLGLPKSKRLAQELVEKALSALTIFERKSAPLEAIARYLLTRRR